MQTVGVELCTKLVQIPEAHVFVVEYILLFLPLAAEFLFTVMHIIILTPFFRCGLVNLWSAQVCKKFLRLFCR